MKHIKKRLGFSLVEVVVSVGIFAVAIVGIIGLFAPTTKTVSAVADSDGSTRALAAIQSYLKEKTSTSTGFSDLQTALGDDSNTTGTGYVYYVTKGGEKVVNILTDANPATIIPNNERFFEFSVIRNATLSPVADKDTAGFLALTISLRWPAFTPSADGAGTAVADSQKSILIVPAAVTR
jgi:type II secretory pathway pseudopilin PulG